MKDHTRDSNVIKMRDKEPDTIDRLEKLAKGVTAVRVLLTALFGTVVVVIMVWFTKVDASTFKEHVSGTSEKFEAVRKSISKHEAEIRSHDELLRVQSSQTQWIVDRYVDDLERRGRRPGVDFPEPPEPVTHPTATPIVENR